MYSKQHHNQQPTTKEHTMKQKHTHQYNIVSETTRQTKKGSVKVFIVRCTICKKEAEKTEAQLRLLTVLHTTAPKTEVQLPEGQYKNPNALCKALLLSRKLTDEEIVDLVKTTFVNAKFDKGYVCTTRNDLNKGLYKSITLEKPIYQIAPEGQTVCSVCGRLLTDPKSIVAGIGPECAKNGSDFLDDCTDEDESEVLAHYHQR